MGSEKYSSTHFQRPDAAAFISKKSFNFINMTQAEKNIETTPEKPAEKKQYPPDRFISDDGFFIGDPDSPMGKYFKECRELIRQTRHIPDPTQHPPQ